MKGYMDRFRTSPGEDSNIQERIDNFFSNAKKELEAKYGENPHFEIKSEKIELSDNRLTYMVYKDYFVAGVFKRTTDFNHLEYIFFSDFSRLE